jgi:hypothetical protein
MLIFVPPVTLETPPVPEAIVILFPEGVNVILLPADRFVATVTTGSEPPVTLIPVPATIV